MNSADGWLRLRDRAGSRSRQSGQAAEQTAEADRGRNAGFASVNVFAGGPGRSACGNNFHAEISGERRQVVRVRMGGVLGGEALKLLLEIHAITSGVE